MTNPEFEGHDDHSHETNEGEVQLSAEETRDIIAEHEDDENQTLMWTAAGLAVALMAGYGIKKYRNRGK